MPAKWVGIYSPGDAARFTRLDSDRLRRWLNGYRWKDRAGEARASAPVFARDLPRLEGRDALSFLDLVEALFVKAFLDQGLSMHAVRRAADEGAVLFGTTHPFCQRRFATDGRTVFARLDGEDNVKRMLDVVRGQFVFAQVIEPLLRQIDFDERTDMAARWWPLGKDSSVVLDPRRSFGEPVVDGGGVLTRVLRQSFEAEQNVDTVADWYGVTPDAVRDAVKFEQQLGA